MDRRTLQAANVVGFVAVIVVNTLANALPLNGVTTAQLSDSYPNLFVPAGYVFSIWGVIYLLLLGFTVYQARSAQRDSDFMDKIGWLFFLSCVFNSVWIFLWHWSLLLPSVIVMFGLLGTLILIYLRLDIGRGEPSRDERLYVYLPFSVYLGWITVAPIANVTALLVSWGWPGYGPAAVNWTMLVIAVAVALSLANVWLRRDVGYNLVIVWALTGIAVKQWGVGSVPYAALIGGVVIAAALAGVKLWKRV
jgi:benzodiazapine receptor